MINVSETTLVEWKKKFERTFYDWDEKKLKASIEKLDSISWIEEQIQTIVQNIQRSEGDKTELLFEIIRREISKWQKN